MQSSCFTYISRGNLGGFMTGTTKSLAAFIASLIILFSMAKYCPESKTTDAAMSVIATIVPAYLIYRSGQDKSKNGTN